MIFSLFSFAHGSNSRFKALSVDQIIYLSAYVYSGKEISFIRRHNKVIAKPQSDFKTVVSSSCYSGSLRITNVLYMYRIHMYVFSRNRSLCGHCILLSKVSNSFLSQNTLYLYHFSIPLITMISELGIGPDIKSRFPFDYHFIDNVLTLPDAE